MKKIIVYILVGFLSVSSISLSYYRSVHAMEWAGGALAFEEALKWTLGLLGITATAGMTDAYWTQYGDEFVEYAEQQNITDTEVAEWQLKLCQGILDKGSECWTAFKNWANNLVADNSDIVGSDGIVWGSSTVKDVFNVLNDYFNFGLSLNDNNSSSLSDVAFGYIYISGNVGGNENILYIITHSPLQFNTIANDHFSVNSGTYKICADDANNRLGFNFNTTVRFTFGSGNISYYGVETCEHIYYSGFSNDLTYSNASKTDIDSIEAQEGTIQSVLSDVSNLDVISGSADNTEDKEVSIPMPGQATSDDTISSDAYQDIIDRINDGTISQEEGVQEIQDLVRVITYDTVTDEVIPVRPDPDTGENEKIDDAIKENVNNAGFTLWGLEKIFPFCIPWDIYAFMNILIAEPVAPKFTFPIKSVNGQTEEIEVDLTPFEPVAVVVRYVFDFLFIVGLGLLTRGLIGGGDSD